MRFRLFLIWLAMVSLEAAGIMAVSAETACDSIMRSYFNDLNDFNSRYPQEKVYLHFDNTAYYLEEDIWFSAYVVRSDNLSLRPLSRVLYVELLSPEGSLLKTNKYFIENGRCHGEFHLDSLYLSGYYEVRAYTRYMLNFGEDAVFSRVFPVYEKVSGGNYGQRTIRDRDLSRRKKVKDIYYQNDFLASRIMKPGKQMREKYFFPPIEKRTKAQRQNEVALSRVFEEDAPDKKTKEIEVLFYPEGGDYLAGANQLIAFSVTDAEGRSLSLDVLLTDSRNKTLKRLKTDSYGNSAFVCKDGEDARYLSFSYRRKDYRFELPKARTEGFCLSLKHLEDSVQLTAFGRKNDSPLDSVWAVALSNRGHIYIFETLKPEGNSTTWRYPSDSLPLGVNTASLFDRDGRVLSERKFYVRARKTAQSQLSLSSPIGSQALNPYQEINLSFCAQDDQGKPVPMSFSLSVRDEETAEMSFNSDNVNTYLLLSSELKGFLPDVSFLFRNEDASADRSLDLLMLTRGWTHYLWDEMTPSRVAFWDQPIERNLMVDGRVYRYNDFRRPCLKNAPLFFSAIVDTVEYYGNLKTNDIGRYAVQLESFYGEGDLYVSLRNRQEQPHHIITFNRWYSPRPKPLSFYEMNFPYGGTGGLHTREYQIQDSLLNLELEEVSVSRRSFRRHVRDNYSLRHYTIEEELEYMLDVYQLPLEEYFRRPDSLILCIMHRYNFPPCVFNTAFAKSYDSDTVFPDAYLYWSNWHYKKDILKMKEIVIRSDQEVTSSYWESKNSVPWWRATEYMSDKSMFYPTKFKVPEYTSTDRPDCVAFFIPCDESSELPPMIPRTVGTRCSKIQGYSYSKEFVHPDYSHTALPDLPADYRRTLYWNPDVKTDSTGVAHIEFYNNSTCRFLSISAEGITSDGTPVVYEK